MPPPPPTADRTSPRVLFAAGGTGGHVYPALAVADALRSLRPDAAVAFAGTAARMEAEAVPKAGFDFHPIPSAPLPRRLSADAARVPGRLLRGLVASIQLVRAFRPDVVVGTGGYVAGPVLLAARLLGRPILIQEQNAFAGVTNRLLGRLGAEVHVAFDAALTAFPAGRATVSGNPVRAALGRAGRAEARSAFGVPEPARLLLVFGGSLGAQRLNDALVAHLTALLDADPDTHVLWATGPRYFDRVRAALAHDRLHLVRYFDRMDLAYAAADLALTRAGALTLAELALTGTPAVLVPSPNVAEDHQTHNARAFEAAGAARLLPEADLDATLVPVLRTLLADAPGRARMAAAARRLARPDAAATIARRVLALAGSPV